jgi:hypothetical protein
MTARSGLKIFENAVNIPVNGQRAGRTVGARWHGRRRRQEWGRRGDLAFRSIESSQSALERIEALGVLPANLIEFVAKSLQLHTESISLRCWRLAKRRHRKQQTCGQCRDDTFAHSSRERQQMCQRDSLHMHQLEAIQPTG